jgi:hypothetical protein
MQRLGVARNDEAARAVDERKCNLPTRIRLEGSVDLPDRNGSAPLAATIEYREYREYREYPEHARVFRGFNSSVLSVSEVHHPADS